MTPKTYNDEFKASAAKLVREQGYSVSKAANSLGVDPSSIRRWVRIFAAPIIVPPDASAEEFDVGIRALVRGLLVVLDEPPAPA